MWFLWCINKHIVWYICGALIKNRVWHLWCINKHCVWYMWCTCKQRVWYLWCINKQKCRICDVINKQKVWYLLCMNIHRLWYLWCTNMHRVNVLLLVTSWRAQVSTLDYVISIIWLVFIHALKGRYMSDMGFITRKSMSYFLKFIQMLICSENLPVVCFSYSKEIVWSHVY